MLFIAMIEAAAFVALSASGDSFGANSAMSAWLTAEFRAANALATNAPAFCCSLSTVSLARLERFSFRSLAYSGNCCFRDSRDMGATPWFVRPHRVPLPRAGEELGKEGSFAASPAERER